MAERKGSGQGRRRKAAPESASGRLPDIRDREQLEAWLRSRPLEVSVVIAARTALRVLPAVGDALDQRKLAPERIAADIVLPVFRATAVAWVAAKYPAFGSALGADAAIGGASIGETAIGESVLGDTSAFDAAGAAASAAVRVADNLNSLDSPDVAEAARMAGRAVHTASAALTLDVTEAAGTASVAFATGSPFVVDVRSLSSGMTAAELAGTLLWPEEMQKEFVVLWERLKDMLLSLDQDWAVWTEWYEDRLHGREADEALEIARATIEDKIWEQGPGVVNARIRELIEQHRQRGPRTRHEVDYVSDRPETARDLLGRAPLAFALASKINRIWGAQTESKEPEGLWERISSWCRRVCDALHITRAMRPVGQPDEAAFILHIDAPWGGGKTTFANFIARILNPSSFGLDASDKEAALLKDLPFDKWSDKDRNRRWNVVHFNAWQHEHVAPPWWNLYEVIRKQCLRNLLHRRGISDPLRKFVLWLWYLILRFWHGLREFLWRVWSRETMQAVLIMLLLLPAVYLVLRYAVHVSIAEFIGEDASRALISEYGSSAVAAAGTGAGIFMVVFRAFRTGLSTFVKSVSRSADAVNLGESDPLFRFQNHFSWFIRQLGEPVLVVVDDLDRCKPAYVVELVRGLLTIFRSPRVVFLLLGDKSWIETAFAHVHADMEKAHGESQISFGGRFAEKAIQLSFILPEAQEKRSDYLVAVLTGRLPIAGTGHETTFAELVSDQLGIPHTDVSVDQGEPADGQDELSRVMAELQRNVRKRFAEARDPEELERAIEELQARIAKVPDEHLRRRLEQMERAEAVFRSSTSERTEEDIGHAIQPLAPLLPGNPRRIKRIVNMIGAFQESAKLSEGINRGSKEWRQLALWTVVMSEYPQVWRMLVTDEDAARELVALAGAGGDDGTVTVRPPRKGAGDAEKARHAMIAGIASDRRLVQLLRGVPFDKAGSRALDDAALVWLRRLTPLA